MWIRLVGCLLQEGTSQSNQHMVWKQTGILEQAWRGWRLVWKLKEQERVKVFLWELAHGKILTNEARQRRGLASNGDCTRCALNVEDCIHLVRDCKFAREVWLKLILNQSRLLFLSLPLREWLEWSLASPELNSFDKYWPAKTAICRWKLWKWRNRLSGGLQLADIF